MQQYPDYVCRVTADEGDIGRGHLQRFQDVETRTPVILTTSQLLTTGVDAPTCKNVVLARVVNSMTEFKQIIGRGTRVRDDYGKLWFNILDYTGTATRIFADPDFDGDPAFATQEEIDENGKVKETEVITPEEPEDDEGELERATADDRPLEIGDERRREERRKFYFDGGQVEIAAELVHELDADGKQLARRQAHRLHRRQGAHALRQPGRIARTLGQPGQRARNHPATRTSAGLISSKLAVAGGQAGRRPVRPALPSRLQRARAHPPPARRPPEEAASGFLRLLRSGSPRNPERPAGEICRPTANSNSRCPTC